MISLLLIFVGVIAVMGAGDMKMSKVKETVRTVALH